MVREGSGIRYSTAALHPSRAKARASLRRLPLDRLPFAEMPSRLLINNDDAERLLHLTRATFACLVDEGFIRKAPRKGFFRSGNIIDGYAEAVRLSHTLVQPIADSTP